MIAYPIWTRLILVPFIWQAIKKIFEKRPKKKKKFADRRLLKEASTILLKLYRC